MITHHKCYFCVHLNLIICEYKAVILSILQSYVFWYHTYILHPGMDRIEAKILQHLYWTCIRDSDLREEKKCDTFQYTKMSNIRYGKLPAKEAE